MSTTVRVTVDEFDAMIARGDFEPREEHHVELIRGEIVPIDPGGPMSPINPPHDDAVDELIDWSTEVLPRGAVRIRAQGSVGIRRLESIPQPDFAWLKPGRYRKERPTPDAILLLVEVSDSTLSKDRGSKSRLYAEAGIRDYWIINIRGRCIEVHRDPVGSTFRSITTYTPGREIRPLAFPEISLAVSRLFPE